MFYGVGALGSDDPDVPSFLCSRGMAGMFLGFQVDIRLGEHEHPAQSAIDDSGWVQLV